MLGFKVYYDKEEKAFVMDYNPAEISAMLPDGSAVNISAPGNDPRRVFADWLLQKDDQYFARAWVNRVWFWVFGRGISAAADDLPLLGSKDGYNRPFSPELEQFLMDEFRKSGYSLRHLYRVILNSASFQASSIGAGRLQLEHGAAYPIRRLEAEVLVDALASVTGVYDQYMSVIPEPFTYLPNRTPAVLIADGSISSGVLDNFGRPPRDSGALSERNTTSTDSQNLYLMNSAELDRRIGIYRRRLNRTIKRDVWRFERIYLDILSRYPTDKEREIFKKYQSSLAPGERDRALNDTVWVLFNSKEFLFHH